MGGDKQCLDKEDQYSVKREVRELLKSGVTDNHGLFTDEYEENITSMIDLLYEAVLIHDDGLIRYANRAALKLFNIADTRDLLDRNIDQLIYLDGKNSVKETDAAYHGCEYRPLKVWINRDGEEPIEGKMVSSVHGSSGQKLVNTFIYNVSERQKMMAELEKASRLNLLSTIAGGVAHDFNNFLAIMLGNISLCRRKLDGNETVYSMMNNIENLIMRAKELANQLLFYAKDGSPTQKAVSLEKLLKDITEFALRGTSVQGEVHVSPKIGPVKIKENQIAEVMNNLIINAVQAMPHGGKIYVRAENIPADRIDNTIPLHLSGQVIAKISVRDEGTGISEKIRGKIFDQFITTKSDGVGLGLPTSYRIIKNNHGDMNFQSRPGEGTTFNIYLPVCEDDQSYQEEKNKIKMKITAGRGKVLVMDDLEPMRKITGEMLNSFGYNVDYAIDGAEAIMLYEKSMQGSAPYDVVLMDVAIPGGMNGTAAIKVLLEMDPMAKVVMVSGYDCNKYLLQNFGHNFKGFLQKPFRIDELAATLEEVLTVN